MVLPREASVIRVSEAPSRRWRNGAGHTVVLHSRSVRARAEPSWTLSLAGLEQSADFSIFPGYDRHLMIAGRSPVELVIDGRRSIVAPGEIAKFAGEAQARVHIVGESSSALNLMTRRSDQQYESVHLDKSDQQGDLALLSIDGDRVADPRWVSALVVLSGALDVSGTTLTECGDTVVIGETPIVVSGNSAVVARIRVSREQVDCTQPARLQQHPGLQCHTDTVWPDERFLQ